MQELIHPRDEHQVARQLWQDGASAAQGGTDLDYSTWLLEQLLIEARITRLAFGISLGEAEVEDEEGDDGTEDADGADPL
jgi:hypothetical protein